MINAYRDGDEIIFCEEGREKLHRKTGTLSDSALLVATLHTNSMTEAHKLFASQFEDVELDNNFDEGWD